MKHLIAAAVAAGLLASAGPARRPGKAHRLVGQGLLQVRGRRAVRGDQEVRGRRRGVKVELSQYPVQDMIPKTVAALDAGTPPDVAYADVYDFQVTGKWAFDGKLEDISDVIDPIKGRFAPNTRRDDLSSTTTRPRSAPTTPSRSSSRRCTSSIWIDMLDEAGFKESDIPTDWKDYWSFWCDKVQPAYRKKTGQARLRHRPADGRRFERLVLFVPDLHGRLQRQAGRRQRQAAGRRSEGARQGLVGALTDYTDVVRQGLHAAVVDELEGPGQQRRLPQQDDGDDPQRDDLDRRQVARRRQQRDAHRRAARDRRRRTTTS